MKGENINPVQNTLCPNVSSKESWGQIHHEHSALLIVSDMVELPNIQFWDAEIVKSLGGIMEFKALIALLGDFSSI